MILHYIKTPPTKEQFREANKNAPPPYPIGSKPKRSRSLSPSESSSTAPPKSSFLPASEETAAPPRKRREGVLPPTRHEFVSTHFRVPHATQEQVEGWWKTYPALSHRNFFVIQRHHATAKHYDLRIQLDGFTISFAIPRGLVDFPKRTRTDGRGRIMPPPIPERLKPSNELEKREGESGLRLAIETGPHPIWYSVYEGGGTGTTAVWDIGAYTMLKTEAAIKRDKKREAELSTDEEEDAATAPKLREDERQEDLLLARVVSSYPAFGDKPKKDHPADKESVRAFAIQLNGERYRGIRLRFSRREHPWEMRTPKGMPRERSDCRVRYASWFVSLFKNDDASKGIEAPLGDVSLLTGRTMDEIKAARINEIKGTVERMRLREHQEAAEIWEAFGLSNLEQGMDDAEWETLPKELGEPGRREGDDGGWRPDWQSRGGEEGWQRDWQSREGDGLETQKYDPELWDKV